MIEADLTKGLPTTPNPSLTKEGSLESNELLMNPKNMSLNSSPPILGGD